MRILRCIHSVNPEGGGPITGIRNITPVLNNLGHTTDIASIDDPVQPYLEKLELNVFPLGPGKGKYGYSARFMEWILNHLNDYDACIIHGMWQYHGYAVRRAAIYHNRPYWIYTHGMLDPWFKRHYPLKHFKKWLYWPWGEYRVLRDAKRVFFTSEAERELARESFFYYKCQETVIPYGISNPPQTDDSQPSAFFEQFPTARGKRIILYLGRLHEKKQPDAVLKAFAEVKDKYPELLLVIAGSSSNPEYERRLRELDKGSVLWTGNLSGGLKWATIRAAEVFILPSHQENYGIAVVEALAVGVPVLISTEVNIWKGIVEDGAGIAEPDTLLGTRKLLAHWLQRTPENRRDMADAARSCFIKRFEITHSATQLIQYLEENIESKTHSLVNGS